MGNEGDDACLDTPSLSAGEKAEHRADNPLIPGGRRREAWTASGHRRGLGQMGHGGKGNMDLGGAGSHHYFREDPQQWASSLNLGVVCIFAHSGGSMR